MIVANTRLIGIPIHERTVVIVAAVTDTISAASNGSSVMSVPTESRVRRAMVNAPSPIASVASTIPAFTPRAPLPTSGATALATLLAPALKPR